MYVDSAQFGDDLYTDDARVNAISEYMSSCLQRVLSYQGRAANATIRVLEIGAGLAWMSRAAKSLQPQSRTIAQDVSPEAVTRCAWVDQYIQGDIQDSRLTESGKYDVISLTHVIEHLADPVDAIYRCQKMLAPNGIIFITAPHRPIGWREQTCNIQPWVQSSYTHVPAHIQYFSESSMKRLAENANCGVAFWNSSHEQGQAFEAWLGHAATTKQITLGMRLRNLVQRALRRIA
jgi:SAM-dependent methyltransferase